MRIFSSLINLQPMSPGETTSETSHLLHGERQDASKSKKMRENMGGGCGIFLMLYIMFTGESSG